MTIIRTGKDDRSDELRLLDEAILIRAETHRMLRLLGETEDADPVVHVAACNHCLEHLKSHAEGCEDGKKLLKRCRSLKWSA